MCKQKIEEFRYYEMPVGRYDLALLGEKWKTNYKTGEQHFHNFFEIGYCHSGEGVVYMGEERPEYQSGSISLIPANFPHGVHSKGDSVCYWEFLYIDMVGFVGKCFEHDVYAREQAWQGMVNIPLLVASEEYPRLSNVIRSILDENREKRARNKEAVNGYLYVLLQELLRLNERMATKLEIDGVHIEKIRPALVYVELYYSKEIKIKELAESCNISEPYFRKLFIECMHMPPLEYVNMVRIQKACDFLVKEDIPMSALAWRVGFSSISTLERNFKKVVGESPKQWKMKGAGQEFVSYRTRALKGW